MVCLFFGGSVIFQVDDGLTDFVYSQVVGASSGSINCLVTERRDRHPKGVRDNYQGLWIGIDAIVRWTQSSSGFGLSIPCTSGVYVLSKHRVLSG